MKSTKRTVRKGQSSRTSLDKSSRNTTRLSVHVEGTVQHCPIFCVFPSVEDAEHYLACLSWSSDKFGLLLNVHLYEHGEKLHTLFTTDKTH